MPILDQCETKISESKSILTFSTTGEGDWPVWDRFIEISGKPAYHIGNICGTCAFFFERLEGVTDIRDPAYSINLLNEGVTFIDEDLLTTTSAILPDGKYLVVLHELLPVLTEPGETSDYFSHEQVKTWGIDPYRDEPHHPKTSYYRLKSGFNAPDERFFEFLIPMFPQDWLNTARVEIYKNAISAKAKPSLLTLSVLDKKEVTETADEGVWSHACLAHYIIDGHHKALAAAETGTPITALSFIALDKGIASADEAKSYAINICGL